MVGSLSETIFIHYTSYLLFHYLVGLFGCTAIAYILSSGLPFAGIGSLMSARCVSYYLLCVIACALCTYLAYSMPCVHFKELRNILLLYVMFFSLYVLVFCAMLVIILRLIR